MSTPESAPKQTIVYTPLVYIEAGEKLMVKLAEEQRIAELAQKQGGTKSAIQETLKGGKK